MFLLKLLALLDSFAAVHLICTPFFTNYQEGLRRNIPFYYEVFAVSCQAYRKIYYKWTLETDRKETVNAITSSSNMVKVPGYAISDKEIPVYERIFRLKLHMSPNSDFSNFVEDFVYFKFIPNKIEVRMAGGIKRTHPAGVNLKLDVATDSRDTSFALEEDDLSGSKIMWRSSPPLRGVKPPQNKSVWEVPARSLKLGSTYLFECKIIRTKIPGFIDSKVAKQKVLIVENVPMVKVKCVKNCFSSNSADTTLFEAHCEGDQCDVLRYKWYSIPDILSKKNIEFGDGTNQLLIKPRVTYPAERYVFGVGLDNATSEMELRFLAPIVNNGGCFVSPSDGIAGVTAFSVECDGFSSRYSPLTYILYQGDYINNDNPVLLAYEQSGLLENIFLAEDVSMLTVVVRDMYLMEAYDMMGVNVRSLKEVLKEDKHVETELRYFILGRKGMSLQTLAHEGDHNSLIQMASFAFGTLTGISVSSTVKRDFLKHIMNMLNDVKLENILLADQILSVLPKAMKAQDEIDTQTTHIQADILREVARVLYVYSSDKYEQSVTLHFVENFGKKILNILSELITRNEELSELMRQEVQSTYYDSYDEMISSKVMVRRNYVRVTESALTAVEYVARSILAKCVVDQNPRQIVTKAIVLTVRKMVPSGLLGKKISNIEDKKSSYVKLDNALVEELADSYPTIDYHFVRFKNELFWWHSERSFLQTEMIMFNLYGNNRKIKTVEGNVNIYLKKVERSQADDVLTGTVKPGELVTVRIEVQPKTVVHITFTKAQQQFVSLIQDCPPSKDAVRKKGKKQFEIKYKVSSQSPTETFLGILNDGSEELTFEGTIGTFDCMFWNHESHEWQRDEAFVSKLREDTLHCQTKHLTLFGGRMTVPPNRIELPQGLSFTVFVTENYLILIILAVVYLVWLILLVWAIYRDKKLSKRNIIVSLDDNVPGDEHGYLMVVVTGVHYDAGTLAIVSFQLVGTESSSRPHMIKCEAYDTLKTGSEDWFLVYTPQNLGELVMVRLWHDCGSHRPHWYCSRIIVQELATGKQYCFVVESWFSLVYGDSEVYREVPVTPPEIKRSRKILFPIIVKRQFRDGHLWLSIFSSSTQSNFTTKERVTLAIAVLMLSMLASAMFYGIPRRDPSDAMFGRGSFLVTSTEFIIVIQSLLVTVPFGIMVGLIFKKSGPPPLYIKEKKKQKKADKKKKE